MTLNGTDAGPSNPTSNTRRRTPKAFASQFGPDGLRLFFWVTYRCPHCSASHFGRSPNRITTGPRRSRCGRKILLVVTRTYLGKRTQGAA